ncbi:MAG: pepsin/retropepsin-like aspartic protease family protein, partial [Verrucomicrobiota bacterium]
MRAKAYLVLLSAVAALVLAAGCSTSGSKPAPARPLRTSIDSARVVLPAQTIGSFLVIEVKWDRYGPYRFLIDTGSSVTLMTPALAKRYPGWNAPGAYRRVLGPDGQAIDLPEASMRRLEMGGVRFDDVPVLLYDCAPFTSHLGVRIDGVLGFPLFREVLLTLDYPGSRVVIQRVKGAPETPGTAVSFEDPRKTPLVPVRLGDRTFVALIDSGSDMTFSLNPVGLNPQFAYGPTVGPTIGSISGDRTQRIGRLSETLTIGDYAFPQPIVDVSDELSAIGAGALRHFAVTFDQMRDRVTFFRESKEPIRIGGRRSAGV